MKQTPKMKSLEELTAPGEFGFQLVTQWLREATNGIEMLPATRQAGEACLLATQVTTRSPMGGIAHRTGGLWVANGWIRVLGAGCAKLPRTLATWNGLHQDRQRLPGALLFADDAVGGFFALNGGRFSGRAGSVYYFAPDSAEWMDLETTYSDWLTWVCTGDIQLFYSDYPAEIWQAEAQKLNGADGILIDPLPLLEGPPFDQRTRAIVPIEELWALYVERLSPFLSS